MLRDQLTSPHTHTLGHAHTADTWWGGGREVSQVSAAVDNTATELALCLKRGIKSSPLKKNAWESGNPPSPQTHLVLAWPSASCFFFFFLPAVIPQSTSLKILRGSEAYEFLSSSVGRSISHTHTHTHSESQFRDLNVGPRSKLPHQLLLLSAWSPVKSSPSGASPKTGFRFRKKKVSQLLRVPHCRRGSEAMRPPFGILRGRRCSRCCAFKTLLK